MATITAANSVFMITIVPIYIVPQRLQGFAADDAFSTEAADTAENVMGVDGRMSSGWLPHMVRQNIHIMPDSESATLFETWAATQDAAREIFPATATISLPAVGRKYTLSNGILTNFASITDVRRVLQARQWTVTWGLVSPAVF